MRSSYLFVCLLSVSAVEGCKHGPDKSEQSNTTSGSSARAEVAPDLAAKRDQLLKAMVAAGVRVPQTVPAPADVAIAPSNAQKLANGVMSVVLKPPTASEHPRPQDKVRLEFAAWTPEGVVIDASQVRGGPVTFSSAEMLPGLASSVAEMAAGEKRRLWIPAELAFGGQRARPGVPLGQVTYDVELVSIERTPDAPSAPPDLTVIPADATRTASGLAYRILHEGEGKVHPITTDTVRVEYTGWTRDGKVFATTVGKGSNLLGVGSAMPGLTEGLQLMTEGEERLFWIPSALGHGEESTPERPAGMLVFDIKLVHIRRVPREN